MFPPCCRGSSGNGGWHVDAFECLLCLYFVLCRVFHLPLLCFDVANTSLPLLYIQLYRQERDSSSGAQLQRGPEPTLACNYYCLPFYINGIQLAHLM